MKPKGHTYTLTHTKNILRFMLYGVIEMCLRVDPVEKGMEGVPKQDEAGNVGMGTI